MPVCEHTETTVAERCHLFIVPAVDGPDGGIDDASLALEDAVGIVKTIVDKAGNRDAHLLTFRAVRDWAESNRGLFDRLRMKNSIEGLAPRAIGRAELCWSPVVSLVGIALQPGSHVDVHGHRSTCVSSVCCGAERELTYHRLANGLRPNRRPRINRAGSTVLVARQDVHEVWNEDSAVSLLLNVYFHDYHTFGGVIDLSHLPIV